MKTNVIGFAIAIIVSTITLGWQPQRVLEFVVPGESDHTDPLGLPGMEYGGSGNGQISVWPQQHNLPLELTIQSVAFESPGDLRRLVVELLILNASAEPFLLPVSLDTTRSAVLPGNADRKMLRFRMRFHAEDGDPADPGGSWFFLEGSGSSINSTYSMAPNESIILRFPVDASQLRPWRDRGVREVQIIAEAFQWLLYDDRYVVQSISQNLQTTNSVSMLLQSSDASDID